MDKGAQDAAQLQELTAMMSEEELLQVAEERALGGQCGSPLCANPFDLRAPKYR